MNGRLLLLLLSCAVTLQSLLAEGRPAWGDWVVAEEGDTGASLLLRRITPKSVFVAPTFTGCSEGYRQDSLGRCVKLVKVNQQSQWNFFLERLNSMYAPSSNTKKPQETGPFHINLPLAANPQESVVHKRLPPPMVEVKTTQQPTSTTPASTTTKTTPTLPASTTTITASTLPASTTTITTPTLPASTTTITSPTTSTSTSTTVQPQSSTWQTTTMSESTTSDVPLSTVDEPSEVTTTEKEVSSTDSTSDVRRETTTEADNIEVMLGDQPNPENKDSSLDTPKNKDMIKQKPFLIIVTNPTVIMGETTSILPEEDETQTSTTEATTEGITNFSTENPESFGESRDVTETSIRPAVTMRPDCQDSAVSNDCEPVETEVISVEFSPSSLPEIPMLDPSSQVRFPSESYVPVRKTQSFVRFPDVANPHEDRPAFWWPSWEIRRYPGIHGWPESSEQIHGSTDRVIQRKYPLVPSWSSMAWQRRFLQRD